MKYCPNCGKQVEDTVSFCTDCGTPINGPVPAPAPAPKVDPYDHSADYQAEDIADSKLYCMLVYLAGLVGVIVALLAKPDSAYTRFHIRESVKATVVEALLLLATGLLSVTVVVPFVGGVAFVVMLVLRFICFVRVCKGRAREFPILCKFGFLK